MAKQKSSPNRKKSVSKIGRDTRGGQFVTVRKARAKLRTGVVERVPPRHAASALHQSIDRSPSTGRFLTSVKGEMLPPRDPKTGSFTTPKSTAAINANVVIFSAALRRLAKK